MEKGAAYRCFCTEERLHKLREDQQNKKMAPRYDRACRDLDDDEARQMLAEGKKYVIRQKMPLEGEIKVFDELRGEIKFRAEDLEDQVLVKSDGVPTYQFASVVDDHLMQISHVVRGEEWIPSFPKNILLYEAFGWEPPKFIHISSILNKRGGKLSKRDGDVTVEAYRDNGYLPEALINFSALIGWSPYAKASGDKSPNIKALRSENKGLSGKKPNEKNEEILSLSEIIEKFDYKDMGISGGIFDVEKLDFFNGYYIRQKSVEELTKLCLPYFEREGFIKKESKNEFKNLLGGGEVDLDFIKKVVVLAQDRLKKISEITILTKFFFVSDLEYDKMMLVWKELSFKEIKNNLEKISEQLEGVDDKNWNQDYIQDKIISYIKGIEGKNGDYLWPMRVALTGEKASPSPFEVAGALGKEVSLKSIEEGIRRLEV